MKIETRGAYALIATLFWGASAATIYHFCSIAMIAYFLDDHLVLYVVLTGFFLIGLGGGSYRRSSMDHPKPLDAFFNKQTLLALCGLLGPLLLLFPAYWFTKTQTHVRIWSLPSFSLTLPASALAVLYGYLTGECLGLLAIALKKARRLEKILGVLLGFDYMGCLMGALLFPLFLYPKLGLLNTLFLTVSIQTAISLYWSFSLTQSTKNRKIAQMALLVVSLGLLFYTTPLEDWLDQKFQPPETQSKQVRA